MIRFLALLALASPAAAAERTLSVGDFERLRIVGSYTVEVTQARATTARISGATAALERTSVEVQGKTLIVRPNPNAWGGNADEANSPVTVRLTVPRLRSIWVTGAGSVTVDRMTAPAAAVTLDGAGRIDVARIEADMLDLSLLGAGDIRAGGRVRTAKATTRGSGTLDAAALTVLDAKLLAIGSGDVTMAVSRAAGIEAAGSGAVTIIGSPACTVRNAGATRITCGR